MAILASLPNNVPVAREIFLCAGQSNGDGRGFLSDLPPKGFPLQRRVKQFKNDWKWYPAVDPLDDQIDNAFKDDISNAGVGPYVAMGSALAGLRPNKEIGLSQGALTSTAMAAWAPNPSLATLYGLTVYKARRALESGGTIKGFCFYQGESDGAISATIANAWGTNFLAMITALRSDLFLPNLPVVFVVLSANPHIADFPYWDNVVAAQLAVTLDAHMARVSAQDLAFRTDSPAQAVHLTTASQIILGGRLATAISGLL